MALAKYALSSLLWMVPSLLGITLVTFLLMEAAPSGRAELALEAAGPADNQELHERQLQRLREHWGLIDPVTKERLGVWERYTGWLVRACTLDLAGPGEDPTRFRNRIMSALPVTLLLNVLALLIALGIAVPLGARLGMARGGMLDRTVSSTMFLIYGLPQFLLATLLVVLLGGGLTDPVFPIRGLRSDGAAGLSTAQQILDMAWHLCLPVATLVVGPTVLITRFLRDSVGRAAKSDFVVAMRAWGTPEHTIRKRALRNGLSPLVTLFGSLLPGLVGGTLVVENIFDLRGLGKLTLESALAREHSMVLAMTLLVSIVTLLGLRLSDLMHRAADPRVQLR